MYSVRSLGVSVILIAAWLVSSPSSASVLESALFCNDAKLEAAAVSDPAHILLGHAGEHVGKIQQALIQLNGAAIDSAELQAKKYGPSTAKAVLLYKQKFSILGPGQTAPDNIVGKKTTAHLDHAMAQIQRCSSGTRPGNTQNGGKTIQFTFRDINGTTMNMKSTSVVLRQRDQEVGKRLLNMNQGVTQVNAINPFNVSSYVADILTVTDPPKGEGITLKQNNLFVDFKDVFSRGDFLLVDIVPGTTEKRFKNKTEHEVETEIGGTLGVEVSKVSASIIGKRRERDANSQEEDWVVKYYNGALLVDKGSIASQ